MNTRLLRLLLLSVMLWGTGALFALDKLPTASCRERNNLTLLHHCNPYEITFLYVDPKQLVPRRHRRNYPDRVIPKARRYRNLQNRPPLLERLVEKYIDYKERLLQRRPIPKGRLPGMVVPENSEPQEAVPSVEEMERPAPKRAVEERQNAYRWPEPSVRETLRALRGEGESNASIGERVLRRLAQERKAKETLPPTTEREKGLCMEPENSEDSGIVRGYPLPSLWLRPAKEKETRPFPAGPILYKVKKGDSFIRLARRFDTTVYDLRKWNGLKKDHLLKIGERLKIYPGKRSSPEEIERAKILENSGRYKVQKGDTLIGITRRFGVDLVKVRKINEMKKGSHIRLGQSLLLPIPQEKVDRILQKEKREKERAEREKRKKYRFRYVNDGRFKHSLRVVATAYTSHRNQTDKTPFLAAWNNRIRPGMKIIAVSHDLIRRYGITNGTKVRISGLPGIYTVRDKMHRRMRKHIDIYMGTNRRKALRWGRRRVMLYW